MEEVRIGQIYQDSDSRMRGRMVEVLSVNLQVGTKGRRKNRYTYAECRNINTKRVTWIDTDQLRSHRWFLTFSPCPVTDEGTQDAHGHINDAATPQQEP